MSPFSIFFKCERKKKGGGSNNSLDQQGISRSEEKGIDKRDALEVKFTGFGDGS